MTVWITHIGGYPKNYHSNIKLQLANNAPQLFICGHSHILKIIYDKKYKLLHLNPGAAGKHGIHQVRTMLYFEVHNDTLKEMKIIELSKRI
jgi:predicted phosphodiesterase